MALNKRCAHVAALVERYIDGELRRLRRTQVRLHLRNCPFCEKAMQFQRNLRVSIRRKVHLNAPPELLERIRRTLS